MYGRVEFGRQKQSVSGDRYIGRIFASKNENRWLVWPWEWESIGSKIARNNLTRLELTYRNFHRKNSVTRSVPSSLRNCRIPYEMPAQTKCHFQICNEFFRTKIPYEHALPTAAPRKTYTHSFEHGSHSSGFDEIINLEILARSGKAKAKHQPNRVVWNGKNAFATIFFLFAEIQETHQRIDQSPVNVIRRSRNRGKHWENR